jgi:hypothetical protein
VLVAGAAVLLAVGAVVGATVAAGSVAAAALEASSSTPPPQALSAIAMAIIPARPFVRRADTFTCFSSFCLARRAAGLRA